MLFFLLELYIWTAVMSFNTCLYTAGGYWQLYRQLQLPSHPGENANTTCLTSNYSGYTYHGELKCCGASVHVRVHAPVCISVRMSAHVV